LGWRVAPCHAANKYNGHDFRVVPVVFIGLFFSILNINILVKASPASLATSYHDAYNLRCVQLFHGTT